ncbi:MAG: caspase family protein [Candidatus Omnitrophota bacterium]|nr:caspase family protein [Candidatus Omnitrophota bacterium]
MITKKFWPIGVVLFCLAGCAAVPTYTDPLLDSLNSPLAASPFGNTNLGVVITENTQKAVAYTGKRTGFWQGSIQDLMSADKDAAPKRIVGDMMKILQRRFKSVVVFENLTEAAASEVDMIMTYDARAAFAPRHGQPTTVELLAMFMTRDRQPLDTIVGNGRVNASTSSYNFSPALTSALGDFVYRLDDSAKLKAHTRRAVAPVFTSEVREIRPKAADLKHGSYYEKSWAVVIGINNYDAWPSLEYAVNDAHAVKQKLKEIGFDEVIEVLDKDATRARLLALLGTELREKVGPEDRVVIFFAGHGQTESLGDGRERGYIIPVDGNVTDYFTTAISMTQVRELSQRIRAKHLLYMMDACYSGLGLTRAAGLNPITDGYIQKITSMRSVQMITAGGKGEQVMELDGHGAFTQYILRGLDGEADRDNDGVVTASELGAFVKPQVSRASDNMQTPQFGRLDGEGDVVFVVRTASGS